MVAAAPVPAYLRFPVVCLYLTGLVLCDGLYQIFLPESTHHAHDQNGYQGACDLLGKQAVVCHLFCGYSYLAIGLDAMDIRVFSTEPDPWFNPGCSISAGARSRTYRFRT